MLLDNNSVIVFYNKNNAKIVLMMQQQFPPIEEEILYENFCSMEEYSKQGGKNTFDYVIINNELYREYIDNLEYKQLIIDPVKKQATLEYKLRVIQNSTYNIQEHKRSFSVDEVYKMYNEYYINFNLKNYLKSNNFKYSFRTLKELHIRTQSLNKNWNYFHSDPFLIDMHENRVNLAKDIVEHGTYWPIVIAPTSTDPDKFYVFEGGHRVTALKLLNLEEELPKDFKLFCLEFPMDYKELCVEQVYVQLKNPFRIRGLIETFYENKILVDQKKLQDVHRSIEKNNYKWVDDYTIELIAENIDMLLTGTQVYPHFLRDLIYTMRDQIKPSPIINDENAFTEWINN
jgi:hypothetical protein